MSQNSVMQWQRVRAVMGTFVCLAAGSVHRFSSVVELIPSIEFVAGGLFLGYCSAYRKRRVILGLDHTTNLLLRVIDALPVFILIVGALVVTVLGIFSSFTVPFIVALMVGGYVFDKGVTPAIDGFMSYRT